MSKWYRGQDGRQKRVWDKNAYPVDETTPVLRDVAISNVTARGCIACAGFFYGLKEMPVEQVGLSNVTVRMAPNGGSGLPAMMNDCPEMSAAGFYLRNAKGVRFRSVTLVDARGARVDYDQSVELTED